MDPGRWRAAAASAHLREEVVALQDLQTCHQVAKEDEQKDLNACELGRDASAFIPLHYGLKHTQRVAQNTV